MNNLNSIIIEGNLTRDPEYHTTPKGTPVCTFSVASNRFYKKDDEQQQEVSFINVETWAKTADTCNQYLHKGRGVRVVGRLKQDRWVGQDGKNRDRIKVVAEHVDFKPVFSKNGERQTTEDGELPTAAAAETSEIAVPPVAEEDEDFLEAV
ncbi:MAG: single-stranded DNA-binding protein [Spirochaetaceae bacterium]